MKPTKLRLVLTDKGWYLEGLKITTQLAARYFLRHDVHFNML